MQPYQTTKQVDGEDVYFTVRWSKLQKADKYEINSKVPEAGGIYELYYIERGNTIKLFHLAKTWYGGLRYWLKEHVDPMKEVTANRRAFMANHEIYYRYTLIDDSDDMDDVLYFFNETYFPGKENEGSSGRFTTIYVDEHSDDKIINR
jgi:hypothetical protein